MKRTMIKRKLKNCVT